MDNLKNIATIYEENLTVKIFSKILYKIKFSDRKSDPFLLSIDLLKRSVKRDLLAITVLTLEDFYIEILNKENAHLLKLLETKGENIFLYLIKNICEKFLTKQYGYKVKINTKDLEQSLYTKNLLQDTELLFQVPYYALLDSRSSLFRSIYYPVYNSASESFLEALIDNLILEISNCVGCFIILNFSSVYTFRQTLYKSKFLSLRNFERFKNNLLWQIRVKMLVKRPTNIYNNRYDLYVLRTSGLYSRTIYANRTKEISLLGKLPLLTIVTIEIKDFLNSRLDETLYILTKGLRFTFTSVIGQVIGLIWRGIIEGLKK